MPKSAKTAKAKKAGQKKGTPKAFEKIKSKVGKTKKNARNHTNTSVKSKQISMPNQRTVERETNFIPLFDLFSHLRHTNPGMRRDSLKKLYDRVKYGSESDGNKNGDDTQFFDNAAIIENVLPLVSDQVEVVRSEFIKVLLFTLQQQRKSQVQKQRSLLMSSSKTDGDGDGDVNMNQDSNSNTGEDLRRRLQICVKSGLSHINAHIQRDGIRLLSGFFSFGIEEMLFGNTSIRLQKGGYKENNEDNFLDTVLERMRKILESLRGVESIRSQGLELVAKLLFLKLGENESSTVANKTTSSSQQIYSISELAQERSFNLSLQVNTTKDHRHGISKEDYILDHVIQTLVQVWREAGSCQGQDCLRRLNEKLHIVACLDLIYGKYHRDAEEKDDDVCVFEHLPGEFISLLKNNIVVDFPFSNACPPRVNHQVFRPLVDSLNLRLWSFILKLPSTSSADGSKVDDSFSRVSHFVTSLAQRLATQRVNNNDNPTPTTDSSFQDFLQPGRTSSKSLDFLFKMRSKLAYIIRKHNVLSSKQQTSFEEEMLQLLNRADPSRCIIEIGDYLYRKGNQYLELGEERLASLSSPWLDDWARILFLESKTCTYVETILEQLCRVAKTYYLTHDSKRNVGLGLLPITSQQKFLPFFCGTAANPRAPLLDLSPHAQYYAVITLCYFDLKLLVKVLPKIVKGLGLQFSIKEEESNEQRNRLHLLPERILFTNLFRRINEETKTLSESTNSKRKVKQDEATTDYLKSLEVTKFRLAINVLLLDRSIDDGDEKDLHEVIMHELLLSDQKDPEKKYLELRFRQLVVPLVTEQTIAVLVEDEKKISTEKKQKVVDRLNEFLKSCVEFVACNDDEIRIRLQKVVREKYNEMCVKIA